MNTEKKTTVINKPLASKEQTLKKYSYVKPSSRLYFSYDDSDDEGRVINDDDLPTKHKLLYDSDAEVKGMQSDDDE